MNKRIASAALALALGTAAAVAQRVTVIVSITNNPVGPTNTFTLNGSTRTWTNSVTGSPATLIQETNAVTWASTNLLDHLTDYPVAAAHYLSQNASNEVRITGRPSETMTASQAGNWASITYSTQTVATPTFVVRAPLTAETETNRTNIATHLVTGLSDYATSTWATNSAAMVNFLTLGAAPLQVVQGPVLFSAGPFGGVVGNLTNGYWTNGVFDKPYTTNAWLQGGTLTNGTVVGASTVDIVGSGVNNAILITATSTVAAVSGIIGVRRENGISTAVDDGDVLANIVFQGYGATAHKSGARIQAVADETFTDASAATELLFGTTPTGAAATVTRLTIDADGDVNVAGRLIVGDSTTNLTMRGLNTINGRVDYTSRADTGLANGNNAGVVLGTNTYVRLSGATTIGQLDGFVAEADGSFHIVEFSGAITNVIANESGVDAVAANRIVTGTGGNLALTNNPSFIQLIYSSAASRWRVVSHSD